MDILKKNIPALVFGAMALISSFFELDVWFFFILLSFVMLDTN